MSQRQPETTPDVVVDCELAHPPDKVWRVLTEQPLIARWLLPNDFCAEVGHRFALVPGAGEAPIAAEVLELEPGRRLRLAWRSEERDEKGARLDSVVSFELQPLADRRTRLRIVHSGLAVRATSATAANVLPFRRRAPAPRTGMRLAA